MMMPSVNLSLLGLLLVVVPVLSSYMGEDYNDVYGNADRGVDNHVYSHTTDDYDYINADRGVDNNVTPRTTESYSNMSYQSEYEESDDELEEPDDEYEESDDEYEEPDDEYEESDDEDKEPDDEVEEPDDEVEEPDDEVEEPDDEVEEPDDEVEEPDDEVEEPDDEVEEPDNEYEESEHEYEEPEDAAACTPIETLPRRVIEHSLTDCCSNNMCDDGYLCRNFNYALKCYPADDQPRNYPKVCNDQPVEGYCKEEGQGGRIELTCKQIDDLGNTLDIIIDNPNTNCISNEDCKMIGYDNYKCRFFQYFLACDTPANFLGVYPALCNAANTDEN